MNDTQKNVPTTDDSYVVTIDGPSGSGKGSLAHSIARELGLNLLDSGAIYRLVALKALRESVDLDDQDDRRYVTSIRIGQDGY